MLTPDNMHREFIGAYNRRDFAAMKGMLHADYVYVAGDGKEAKGIDAGLQNAYLYAHAFPDAIIDIARVFVCGNTAIAELVARGTHSGELQGIPPTERSVELVMCNVMELRNGRIHREREYVDRLAMLEQIGVIPNREPAPVPAEPIDASTRPDVQGVEERVRTAIRTLETGWNRHDMDLMFEAFTPDAEWVNVVGMWWRGLVDLKRAHRAYHDTFFASTSFDINDMHVRFVADDAAIAVVRWHKGAFLPPDGLLRPAGRDIMSLFLVEREGQWLIAAGHNTTIEEEALPFDPIK